MKLRIFILCLLLAASVIAMPALSIMTDSRREDVEVFENVLLGSPEEVEGVQVDVTATYEDHLFWKVSHKHGQKPETDTSFEYSGAAKRQSRFIYSRFISCYCEMYYGYTGRPEDLLAGDVGVTMLYEPAKALLEETPDGETKQVTVRLSDYYDYYPLAFYTNSTDEVTVANLGEEDIYTLRDYFRIPVADDILVDVKVDRSSLNKPNISVEMQPHDLENGGYNADFECVSFVRDGRLFFSINFNGNDISCIKGGYGIYTLDLPENKNDVGWAKTVKTVIPLEANLSVMDMRASEDGERLNAVCIDKNSRLHLFVYSLKDMSLSQEVELGGSDRYSASVFWNGDRLLTINDAINYVEPDREGVYHIKASAPSTDSYDLGYHIRYPLEFAFDGQRLVIVSYGRYSPVSWVMCVIDERGLVYLSESYTSLNAPIYKSDNTIGRFDTYSWSVGYSDIEPLRLTVS